MPDRTSFWIDTAPGADPPPLRHDIDVDVAVVGAGIVGLTAAERLTAGGARVAVLEAGPVAHGVSGHTTAKVTALHGLLYRDLVRMHDRDRAQAHAEAQQAGIDAIWELTGRHGIECDLVAASAYTFAETADEADTVKDELATIRELGLDARPHGEGPLAAPHGAVGLDGQAQFQPCRYLYGLARAVAGGASVPAVHAHTRVVDVTPGSPCRVATSDGATVRAERVVLATHMPVSDRGLFFARVSPRRAYALAMDAGDHVPDGMYINASGDRSVRPAPYDGRTILIVAGAGHPVGEEPRAQDHWGRLEQWARDALGAGSVLQRWSTQDNDSLDRLPLVGPMLPGDERMLAATGFGGWGLTAGTIAGQVLADRALGRENAYSDLYDPHRLALRSVPDLARKGVHDVGKLAGDRLRGRLHGADVHGIAPGQGRVVNAGGDRVAVHRDHAGALHAVDADCTHLGCVLSWNDAELSWDCPCHGSRFAPDGAVLHGPATMPLASRPDALP